LTFDAKPEIFFSAFFLSGTLHTLIIHPAAYSNKNTHNLCFFFDLNKAANNLADI